MISNIVFEDEIARQDATPDPEVVTFTLKNPLGQKNWPSVLLESEVKLRKEINDWWFAWLRRLLPNDLYEDATSQQPDRFFRAAKYMAVEGIKFDNPNGRSLERHVYHKGVIVGIFRIELVNGL